MRATYARRGSWNTRVNIIFASVALTATSIFAVQAAHAESPPDNAPMASCQIHYVLLSDTVNWLEAGDCPQVRAKMTRYHKDFGYLDFLGSWGYVSKTGPHTAGGFVNNYERHETLQGSFTGWTVIP